MAIGATGNDGNGGDYDAGHVRIYENISGSWSQIGQDIDGESAYDYSGYSLSLSSDGSIVAIGASENDGNGSNSGHVRIYENIGGSWSQIGQDIDGEAAEDYSGYAISLSSSGSTVAIGAYGNDGNGGDYDAGHVRIYENISGSWSQIGQDIDGESLEDESGRSVSLSSDGSIVAIGAAGNSGNGSNSGHVRIYENIGGSWSQIGQDIDGEVAEDNSGWSVSLSNDGNTVAIGANSNDGNGDNSGHVRIYENIGGSWSQIGQDIDGEATDDQSGQSVSLSNDGSKVAIGAGFNMENGANSGHVRIYENIGGSWYQVGQDIDGEAAYDYSGWSVSLSSDGNSVAIGAPYNDGNGAYSGHVRVFDLTNSSPCAGCTDPLALNYDSTFAYDDGSCIYCLYGCTDSTALNYDSLATCDDGSCITPIYGCTDTSAINYYSGANIDDGSCVYCLYGCTDSTALNYDSLATCDDGSCIAPIYGCTDTSAINYYSGANIDDGSCIYAGCTDSLANNYDPTANVDDGTCDYTIMDSCLIYDPPTGLSTNWSTDTKAEISWDNMNDSFGCMVWKYYVRYRAVGDPSWTTKSAGVGNGLCNFGLNTTSKILQNLTSGTTYDFKMKAFYCGGTESGYSSPSQFTTAGDCPEMTNLSVQTYTGNQSKATFSWDTTGVYVFARVALRVDTAGASWQTAGGFGVYYPTFTVNKFGLQSGESYRAQGRTFCDSNITSYRSWWTTPVFWTQPGSIRMSGGTTITNLDVYPNPTDDIFNISFVSEEIQTLSIRVLNIVGEVVYIESLEKFVGEYTKQLNIGNKSKGVYFLEISDNNGIINKKIILQ